MNLNGKRQDGLVDKKNLTLRDYGEIFWRRKWWFVLPVVLGTIIAVVYSYSVPSLYRSSTLIMVEDQAVPTSYVSPTVTSTVEHRLNTISQQILSRTNLEKIIRQFGLYKDSESASTGLEGVAERVKTKVKKVLTSLNIYEVQETIPWVPEEHVNRMREAIAITVLGDRHKKNAFTIAYTNRNPETAMQVTNALASLFIEENLKVRERQAEGTSKFLASELSVAEKELQALEGRLKEFKERHQGALPEQLDANLRTLDRLQLELQTVNESVRNAAERKVFYEQQFESTSSSDVAPPPVQQARAPQASEVELERLRRELARLQAEFNDNYPDIVVLKKRISDAETQIANEPVPQESPRDVQKVISDKSEKRSQLEGQIRNLDAEISALKLRQESVLSNMREYERRIEETYGNELQLLSMVRDYGMSKSNYETLLEKRLNAKMSENLEKRQKGEQFRILDPANMPKIPYTPDRRQIILLGSLLSGAVGVGLIFLLEYLNPYFRNPEDLQATLGLPVLAVIPRNRITKKTHRGRLVSIEEPESIASEQYRVLYAKLHDIWKAHGHKVFAISSSLRGEGRTATALNLAVIMARDFGKRTLLLEGDFRTPTIASYLKAELESGLVDILLSKTDLRSTLIPFADTLIPFADDNLSVLPAVKSVQNSSGLLSSQRMKDLLGTLREQYDFILVDAPPILPLSDMQVFEEVVDGIILLVRAEKTPRDILQKAVDVLGTDKLAGMVLNDSQSSIPGVHKYEYARV
jgi:polysaccharide chain length determinant protein (PEP-CTERM system associated)